MGGLVRAVRATCGAGLAALVLCLSGCASTPTTGSEHVVKPGENLYRLSRYYGVPIDDIRAANDIRDVRSLQVGQRLVIPGSSKGTPAGSLALSQPRRPVRAPSGRQVERLTDLHFAWPVTGKTSSKFGGRRGRNHDGIDIAAKSGTPIRAAEAGRVIHSGRGLGDYGNVVIVKHAGRYSTVYAHNRRNRVRKGDFVEKGQVIAEVGKTGNATGPHVHFEVRRDRQPQNPLSYLP